MVCTQCIEKSPALVLELPTVGMNLHMLAKAKEPEVKSGHQKRFFFFFAFHQPTHTCGMGLMIYRGVVQVPPQHSVGAM